MSGSPSRPQTRPEPVWTRRQREVLDLLVRGRTNPEIATALGISLDGAKWHVSEVITKLGVDSRDEAAEYWRAHNGLRPRFTRIFHALIASTWLKVGASVAVVAGASVAVAAVMIGLNDSGTSQVVALATPVTAVVPPGNTSVDYAMKVRSSYGLRFDRPYVESVESDPTASRELGIALTADEVSEVKASETPVLLVLEPLTRELEADPTFGGIYLDRAAGGVLDIATTADVSHFVPVVARFASSDVRLRVRQVSYTLAELKSLQARVTSDVASWQGQGIQISTVFVDVVNNRLAITVVALTPAAKISIEMAYGPRVAVSAGEAFHF